MSDLTDKMRTAAWNAAAEADEDIGLALIVDAAMADALRVLALETESRDTDVVTTAALRRIADEIGAS